MVTISKQRMTLNIRKHWSQTWQFLFYSWNLHVAGFSQTGFVSLKFKSTYKQ